MEDDVLSQGLDLPETLKIGDRLISAMPAPMKGA